MTRIQKTVSMSNGNSVATSTTTLDDLMPSYECEGPAGIVYKGARYIAKFADPIEWNSQSTYEYLTVVQNEGDSYVSKQNVPVGVDISNTEYWLHWADYNAQYEGIRQRVDELYDIVMPTFATVSDLKSSGLESGYAHVLGYEVIGDCVPFSVEVSEEAATAHTIPLNNGKVASHVKGDAVSARQFGAKGDGTTDDTMAFKAMYEFALSGTTVPMMVEPGTYRITQPLVDASSAKGVKWVLEGAGKQLVNIVSTADVLFDNEDVFGFSLIKGITFTGNNSNTFMKMVSNTGGSGNPQSITVDSCDFYEFITVVSAQGQTMDSELFFTNVKIKNCGTETNNAKIFVRANPQSVNWNFVNVHAETFIGSLMECTASPCITWYGGSIIPINAISKVVNVPSTRNDSNFGPGNNPSAFIGCRFEMRDNSKLVNVEASTLLSIDFIDCGMGGLNRTSLTENRVMNLNMRNTISFKNCYNMNNYSTDVTINTPSKLNAYVIVENCDLDITSFMKNSNFNLVGNLGYGLVLKADGVNYYSKTVLQKQTASLQNISINDDQSGYRLQLNGGVSTLTVPVYAYVKSIDYGITGKGPSFNYDVTFTAKYGDNQKAADAISLSNGGSAKIDVNSYIDELTIESVSNSGGSASLYAFTTVVLERM